MLEYFGSHQFLQNNACKYTLNKLVKYMIRLWPMEQLFLKLPV